jgi:salicylate hydroxylase
MDPAIIVALKRCGAVPIADKSANEDDHLRWIDGYNQHHDDDPSYQKPLAELGGSGFYGCRRDQFLEELAKDVPPGVIMFHKRLDNLKHQKDGKIQLEFVDGSAVQVDAGMSITNSPIMA